MTEDPTGGASDPQPAVPNGSQSNLAGRTALACTAIAVASALLWGGYYLAKPSVDPADMNVAAKAAASDIFGTFALSGLIPIVRPGHHNVGAVYDPMDGTWLYEASSCFPGLKTGAPVASSLPSIEFTNLDTASAGLGIDGLLLGSIRAETLSRVSLAFSDVELIAVPQQTLLSAFSPLNCPLLVDVMESIDSGVASESKPLLIVREVYRAKRRLSIKLKTQSVAKEEIAKLKAVGANADLKHSDDGSYDIVLENQTPLPVAARPAFVLAEVGVTLGSGEHNRGRAWLPLDPELGWDAATERAFYDLVRTGLSAGNR